MQKLLITTLLLSTTISLYGQKRMSLDEAMQYAIDHSADVEIARESRASSRAEKVASVASLFPSLSASSSLNNSYGRSIDPETNTYTTTGNLSNQYSINSGLTIFNGLRNINAVKVSKLKVEMGGHSTQQQKDAVALRVMQLYFDLLYCGESIALVDEQRVAAEKVLKLTTKQQELGLKSEADVALSRSQVATYSLLLTQQESLYSQTLLNLKEAMNFPFDEELQLCSDVEVVGSIENERFDLELNPEYQVALSQLNISRTNLKIARGAYTPTLSVVAGYNNYYFKSLADGASAASFRKQFKINYGYYIGASLSIPIFNNLSYRTSVARNRHALRTAELDLHKTELRINKAANEAILLRNNSQKEQLSAASKVEATQLAHKATERKYEQGIASIIDLQTTANDLLKAKAEELRARLNYHIENRTVNYYISGTL